MENKKPLLVVSVVAVVCLIICCCIVSVLGLVYAGTKRGESQSESMGNGTLNIISYSQSYPEYADENDVPDKIELNAILEITPKINGKSVFVTDKKGRLTIENVPEGEYKIQPIHNSSSYSRTVKLSEGETKEVTVVTAPNSLNFYKFNLDNSNPPLNKKEVRQALGLSINREEFFNNTNLTNSRPSYNFIPYNYNDDGWGDKAAKFEESTIKANSLTKTTQRFNIKILTTELPEDGNDVLLNQMAKSFKQIDKVDKVSDDVVDWDTFLEYIEEGRFELARYSWILDSNNILEFYKSQFGPGNESNYNNPKVNELIEEGNKALENGNIERYEEILVEINDIVVDDAPVIPLYWYEYSSIAPV